MAPYSSTNDGDALGHALILRFEKFWILPESLFKIFTDNYFVTQWESLTLFLISLTKAISFSNYHHYHTMLQEEYQYTHILFL